MANYKDAGVDVHAGYKAVELMKKHIKKTMRPEVIADIGGFGGLFSLEGLSFKKPVLVSGTDGVGTKLKLAFLLDKHDTVGIDCVAMCVNDLVCQGAKPLFFLDYIATAKLFPQQVTEIVKGISQGCIEAGCALIGGETAEMPGFYKLGEYDVAGFAVGIVDRKKIIDGSSIKSGDALIGLASNGVHSNGFSLVRKLLMERNNRLNEYNEEFGKTIGEELLKPTRIYVKGILELLGHFSIKGLSHITGGGFIENIPRMLPQGLSAEIGRNSWPIPPIFHLLKEAGQMQEQSLYNTFNMGIGMVLACAPDEVQGILASLKESGYPAYLIGKVIEGQKGMVLR